jgi:hypothetical protein
MLWQRVVEISMCPCLLTLLLPGAAADDIVQGVTGVALQPEHVKEYVEVHIEQVRSQCRQQQAQVLVWACPGLGLGWGWIRVGDHCAWLAHKLRLVTLCSDMYEYAQIGTSFGPSASGT